MILLKPSLLVTAEEFNKGSIGSGKFRQNFSEDCNTLYNEEISFSENKDYFLQHVIRASFEDLYKNMELIISNNGEV